MTVIRPGVRHLKKISIYLFSYNPTIYGPNFPFPMWQSSSVCFSYFTIVLSIFDFRLLDLLFFFLVITFTYSTKWTLVNFIHIFENSIFGFTHRSYLFIYLRYNRYITSTSFNNYLVNESMLYEINILASLDIYLSCFSIHQFNFHSFVV